MSRRIPESSRFRTSWPISMISPIRSTSGISPIMACSMCKSDELTGPRELGAWMAQRGLLFTGAKITPAMFDAALQLRTGVRAYLQCDPVERRGNSECRAGAQQGGAAFPLVAEARDDRGMVLQGLARRCPGRTVGRRRRTVRRFHHGNSRSIEDVCGRRVSTGVLRSVEAGDAAVVHVDAMRQPDENADLPRAPSRRRLSSKNTAKRAWVKPGG